MESKLEMIAHSYDRTVELGRKGVDQYANLPEHIKNHSFYKTFIKARKEGFESHSGRKAIYEYLSPAPGMKFIDLGCCLNLVFNGYDEWPSQYHGVDISQETITLLRTVSINRNLPIGSLYNGCVHDTPYIDSNFDIGACIGVLEYYERSYVEIALQEFRRIIKPRGRFVLDIPNTDTPMRQFFNLLEEHLGRPVDFDLSPEEFEEVLEKYFIIERKDSLDSNAMIQYFCSKA